MTRPRADAAAAGTVRALAALALPFKSVVTAAVAQRAGAGCAVAAAARWEAGVDGRTLAAWEGDDVVVTVVVFWVRI